MQSKDNKHKVDRSNASEAKFAYDGLDRVMHEKARLGILASLAAHPQGLLFNDLKQLCALTDGNLSRHLGVLSEAALVEIWKGATGTRPQTMYRLTNEGRARFNDYLSVLERVVSDAQAKQSKTEGDADWTAGDWSPA
ncbi:MAG: transcriptional regulator [Planctomycetota bacterium]